MNTPEKGFYYHYKHKADDPMNYYAYEVMGVGHHTEDEDAFFVVYRPIYEEAKVYKIGKFFDIRPLEMFMEDVTKEGKTFPRFQRITDPDTISKLIEIRDKMYTA
jgi:hypothetical protein